jgi:outer membrane receptor for ferrienterochelin and colicins
MKSINILIILFLTSTLSVAQSKLKGIVYGLEAGNKKSELVGATIVWQGTSSYALADEKGMFEIDLPDKYPAKLIVSFVGYLADTIEVKSVPTNDKILRVTLPQNNLLEEFVVEAKRSTTYISPMEIRHVQTITEGELRKAACCNLSESFETNVTVDVKYTDAVSGAKKIQMLGLDGVYSQIQFENFPLIRGLSSAYGINYIPGTWVKAINLSKGTGSVMNGYESITGQIDLTLHNPPESDKWYINLYGNHNGRGEINLHTTNKISKKLSSMTFLHANNMFLENDHNHDGFLDAPMKQQYTFLNRWNYESKNYEAKFGVRALYEDVDGGTITDFNKGHETHISNFNTNINTKWLDVFFKNGFFSKKSPYKSLGIIANAKYYNINADLQNTLYNGVQKTFYVNSIFSTVIKTTDHKLNYGVSLLADEYDEKLTQGSFNTAPTRTEVVPGAFTEYTFDKGQKLSYILGFRLDYHNLFGLYYTPRFNLKYRYAELSNIRITAGRGYRTPNIIGENLSNFVSNRTFIFTDEISPEIAWNFGGGVNHFAKLFSKDVVISADVYHTLFENQMVVDLENPRYLEIYNLKGQSYATSAQFEFMIEPIERFEVKTAYKWNEVKTTYNSGLKSKPFVPTHRGMLNLSYATDYDKWQFDFTGNIFGEARIPDTWQNNPEYQLNPTTDTYFTFNAQVTKKYKKWEFYLGGENLLNYIQPNAIISSNNPSNQEFDASLIWGPVNGRMIYAGLRYQIKKFKKQFN